MFISRLMLLSHWLGCLTRCRVAGMFRLAPFRSFMVRIKVSRGPLRGYAWDCKGPVVTHMAMPVNPVKLADSLYILGLLPPDNGGCFAALEHEILSEVGKLSVVLIDGQFEIRWSEANSQGMRQLT